LVTCLSSVMPRNGLSKKFVMRKVPLKVPERPHGRTCHGTTEPAGIPLEAGTKLLASKTRKRVQVVQSADFMLP
jgi:hypothetical protein